MSHRILDQKLLLLKTKTINNNCSKIDSLEIVLEQLADNIWKYNGKVWKYETNISMPSTVYLLYINDDDIFQLDIMLCGGLYSSITLPADTLHFPDATVESHQCCGIPMNTMMSATVTPHN